MVGVQDLSWTSFLMGKFKMMTTIAIARNDFSNIVNRAFNILKNLETAEELVLAEMANEAMKEAGENISLEEMKKNFGRC
ncbi:hypothetical protein PN36_33370 [Candidatus Thiomargarita nelsonii]|uniref:Uncharacterized protein n=1 Tax=Candidatus Thiomargarita nelsonii TaxID=1003181 RepID=A0A4E0QJ54_9GAMM|nr:hypothetical protein PN36_33370 [Candidatus Thiomargarita nelsonii]